MPKKSVKQDKSFYWIAREEAGLTRAEASEKLQTISESRLEKLENGTTQILPEDVLAMEKAYNKPGLCNHYCAEDCPIGQEYVPSVKVKDLSQIVIEMLATLNALNRQRERLIDITEDGVIDEEELADFVTIQDKLEKISIVSSTLKLWVDHTVASGKIEKNKIDALRN